MDVAESGKSRVSPGRIVWLSLLKMDVELHKSSQLAIMDALAKLGYEVDLVALRSRNIFQNKNSQIRVICVPLRSIPFVSNVMFTAVLLFLLPLYIIFRRPDYVITEPNVSIFGFAGALPFSMIRKPKFVLDIRSVPVETTGFEGFATKVFFSISVRIAKRMFHGITIITPLMKEEVSNSFGLNSDKIGVWTSGVSDGLFNPDTVNKESLKRKFGLTEKFVVFYHGVFTASRGLTQTIAAMKILSQKHPAIVFFLLGTGPIAAMLKALVQRDGLQQNIVISNPVDQVEVPKFIGMCDVGIVPLPDHPYWRLQSPLKLLEYLAMQKVVILTDLPAHRAVIGDANCGVYISSTNPTEIAEKIEYVYLNRASLDKWGKIGRQIVKQGYTWEKVACSLESYLLSIDNS